MSVGKARRGFRLGNRSVRTVLSEPLEPRRLLAATLLADINLTPLGSDPREFVELNGAAVFTANGLAGPGLYRTDGTAAGTARIAPLTVQSLEPAGVFGGWLFFSAMGPEGAGHELWKTDGTAAGTMRVKDINAGTGNSGPGLFHQVNGELRFVARDNVTGGGFWKSDGTEAGTVFLHDPVPDNLAASVNDLTVIGDSIYYSTSGNGAQGMVWKSDLAFASPQSLIEFANDYTSLSFMPAGDRVAFRTFSPTFGSQLGTTDGTPGGTTIIRGGVAASSLQEVDELVRLGDRVFFTARSDETGRELWKTDGTDAGTALVRDLGSGSSLGPDSDLTVHRFALYFAANGDLGSGLWRSDGTADGTTLLKQGTAGPDIEGVGNTLFFGIDSGLWKTDGTAANTVAVRQPLVTRDGTYAPFNGGLLFAGEDLANGVEPWFSDGTAAATVALGDLNPRTMSSSASTPVTAPVVLNGRAMFPATRARRAWRRQTFGPPTAPPPARHAWPHSEASARSGASATSHWSWARTPRPPEASGGPTARRRTRHTSPTSSSNRPLPRRSTRRRS